MILIKYLWSLPLLSRDINKSFIDRSIQTVLGWITHHCLRRVRKLDGIFTGTLLQIRWQFWSIWRDFRWHCLDILRSFLVNYLMNDYFIPLAMKWLILFLVIISRISRVSRFSFLFGLFFALTESRKFFFQTGIFMS